MFICVEACFWRYTRVHCTLAYLLEHFSRPTECKARCFALPAARDVSLGKPKESCWALNERRQNMWITIATMDLLHAACGEHCPKWFLHGKEWKSATSTESKECFHQKKWLTLFVVQPFWKLGHPRPLTKKLVSSLSAGQQGEVDS